MASFKALCLAGVASLVATAAAQTGARAADMPFAPPPPPPVIAPPPVVLDGGFYLRGDVGVGINDLNVRKSTFDTPVPDARFENSSIGDSPIIDVGVGYRINNYFRVDATAGYRGTVDYRANESYNVGAFFADQYGNPQGNGARAYDNYSGHFRAEYGLLNGYVDLGTWNCITPFVGAGFGVANIETKGLTDISYGSGAAGGAGNGGGGFAANKNQINFAFAAMAGLDFAVTPNLTLELSYRYLNLGNVSSAAINCVSSSSCPNEVQHYKLESNDIRVGFRYNFASIVGPGPLVRKY